MPTLTEHEIEALIDEEDYHVFPNTNVTVCCLTLLNGCNTIGYSICIDPVDFDARLGREIAFENARRKIWELEGYRTKDAKSKAQ